MYTELFEIEFQVPDVEEQYITFELEVYGGWKLVEIGGGIMREALDWDSTIVSLHETFEEIISINNWIAKNYDEIRKMFAERIKKYED